MTLRGWTGVGSHVINGTGKDKKRPDGRYEVIDKTGCLNQKFFYIIEANKGEVFFVEGNCCEGRLIERQIVIK